MAGGKRKAAKDPDAPKAAWSAYFFFCDEFRSQVKQSNPSLSLPEVAKELGRMWRTSNDKSKYEAKAAKDKERYQREIAVYKSKGGGDFGGGAASGSSAAKKSSRKPAPKARQRDDDDEDDDDDE